MEIKRKPLIATFALMGIFFVSLAFYFSYQNTPRPELGLRIGYANKVAGISVVNRPDEGKKIKIDKSVELRNFDIIETHDDGEVLLTFESGYSVKMPPLSQVSVERVDDPENISANLTIRHGDVVVEKVGRENGLFISKNGTQIAAQQYNESLLKKEKNEKGLDDFSSGIDNIATLSEEEISGTMSSYKTSFAKCFASVLQKNSTTKAEATLTFTIENNGHSSFLEVTSNLDDDVFKNCIKSVMERVVFKPFQGPPISTIFPLKFE